MRYGKFSTQFYFFLLNTFNIINRNHTNNCKMSMAMAVMTSHPSLQKCLRPTAISVTKQISKCIMNSSNKLAQS